MINVNLRPGAAKKTKAKRPGLGLDSLSRFKPTTGSFDRLALAAVISWLVLLPLTAYLFLGARSRLNDLNVSIEGARADSTKYAGVIAANKKMLERRDTIAQKVNIIQGIDANRYVWSHIMDEISRSLPPYTWLIEVSALPSESTDSAPNFKMIGRTGNNFALTRYLQDLEASPFIRNVKLASTELVRENEKLVYSFNLEASYEVPPPDVIQTVPLFTKEPE
jgi:Tfp pilus assembly protein PilN